MDFSDKKVLVVEDNEMNRMLAGFSLNEYGIEPEEAEDGQAAVDLYNGKEEGYYDLILMDIMMPGMDGIEATNIIRNAGKSDSSSIPIVAMTAETEPEEIAKFPSLGFSDYLEKPMEDEALEAVLIKYLA